MLILTYGSLKETISFTITAFYQFGHHFKSREKNNKNFVLNIIIIIIIIIIVMNMIIIGLFCDCPECPPASALPMDHYS